MTSNRATFAFLAALTAVAVFFCYLLAAPFLKPIAFSVILAIIFYPVHARMCRWIHNRNAAAFFSTTVVIFCISLAAGFLGRAAISGLADIYQSLVNPRSDKEKLGIYIVQQVERALGFVDQYFSFSVPNLRGAISNQAEGLISSLLAMAAGFLGSVTSFLVSGAISFFILFFFLRDGRSMLRRLAIVIPLRPGQVTRLYACVKDTLKAILYGTLAIAAIQGALTGIAFSFLGISSPVLWGIVTSLCSLLPVIGTAFVFLPAIGMLLFNGHWIRSLILLIWAVAIVHPVDNVLRPYLIGERAKISTLYVFFALLGGLRTFGGLGVFLGPLIVALTVALFRFLREEKRAGGWSFPERFGPDSPPRKQPSPELVSPRPRS
jgi:predicted PurR-regulated permease PerM